MKSVFQLSMYAAVAAAITLSVSGCSDPVQPTPVDYVLEVNDENGRTLIDTNAIDDIWPAQMTVDSRDIPIIIRQLEAEQLGFEGFKMFTTFAVITPYLVQMKEGEESQSEAVLFMIGQLGLSDSTSDILNGPGKGEGAFDDDSTQIVWDYLEANPPKNELEALAAYAYIAEFQYNHALDASRLAVSASAKSYWEIVVAMNKNHFVSGLQQARTAGVVYTNAFLTDAEFNDVQDDGYVKF